MSLPPGFLDELRARTTLSHVVGRKVTWDQRKSNQAKGDFWAPCPFHQEKTASFHVDDRKGYYYCFGCHAKGDALSFLREAEAMPFMEAVETLARAAGMAMPAADPKAAERADRRGELAKVMEEAVRHYRLQLRTSAGAAARDYLARRKLSETAQDRFEIGFAPEGWQGLWDHLKAKGIADDLILDAGLAKASTKGKAPYDVFRNRIMFPIRDARGRCIAFGGRAMDPADSAKYLNSPETELFDKGRTLYNHGPAREAAGKGQRLVVAEGYMDVIALVGAGFEAAVAPLGTAITEDQLQLLWRIHPEPLIMLDGDTAGIRAATRLVDLALPLLKAGQGLRFVILPEGLDPDDLIRSRGREAMAAAIDGAEPMVNLLWRRETESRVFDSPERKAALDKILREAIRRIADPSIRAHYGDEIKRLRWELFAAGRSLPQGRAARRTEGGAHRFRSGAPAEPLPGTRASLLAAARVGDVEDYLREAMILAIAITHPACVTRFESEFETLHLRDASHERLRNAVLSAAHDGDPGSLRERVARVAGAELEKLFALTHVRIAPPVRNADDYDFAEMCLAEELAKLEARRGMEAEVAEAMEDLAGLADEGLTWRLSQAAEARHRAERSKLDDDSDMGEDRGALSAGLQRLIDAAVWEKKKP
ncbi:MAG: DNA primase [Rhodobacteraceae bacterium]|jgi:DNA primase|uniref:DNA primase n=1 Tax=Albidovulum sp. TaxID=1872424 RepID=UPI001DF53EF9|nr:DNA primase [uncultured Defluviimonas sp.]MCB2125641.1 DNA primase [Paracoccaceae bacterium]MCC0069826.1 DNA primase [Paracoccaceae bacterium]